jgi:two-component system sensor histidine kinase UhpB
MDEVLPPDLAPRFAHGFREALKTGEIQVLEYTLPIGGEERWYEARIGVCGADRLLSVVRDITDRVRARATVREREQALTRSNARIRDLARRLIRAQELERRYLARELHDDLNQKLAALGIAISALKREYARPGEGGASFDSLHARILEISGDIRALSHHLHPAVLEHAGLGPALRSHCADVGRLTGLELMLTVDPDLEPIRGEAALCVYRVVQEALQNIAKHAASHRAEITLSRADEDLLLSIADRGGGFNLEEARRKGGLGLISMEERVNALGGSLRIDSDYGAGTLLQVRLPLQPSPG